MGTAAATRGAPAGRCEVRPALLMLVLAHAAVAAGPQLVSSTPAQGQDGVVPTAAIKLVFSVPMDANSLSASNAFTLYDLTNGFAINPYPLLGPDGLTVTFNFIVELHAGAAYRLDLNAAVIRDRSGNALVATPPIFFNTFLHPSKTPPSVTGTVPANGESGVATNTLIYVVFDEPIANLTYDPFITVNGAAGPIKFTSSVVADRVLQIKNPLLFPPNQPVSVSITGIIDRNGNPLAVPLTFAFQTGTLPDAAQQSMALAPPLGAPVSLPIHFTFSKPLDPPLVAVGSVQFQSYSALSVGDMYPGTLALSADRRTLTIDAAVALPPGGYQLQISIPFDRTQGKMSGFLANVVLDAPADPTPAQLLAASPPDGSSDVPITTLIRLAFTKPVDFGGAPGAISLATSGGPVAGGITVDNSGTVATFKPQTPLQPSTTYTISCNGLSDFFGNTLAPCSATFGTGSGGGYDDPFTVVSTSPADSAKGVDPLSAIQITFSHPVAPVSLYGLYSGVSIIDSNNASVPGAFTVNGGKVTFQPSVPMANGNVRVVVNSVLDLAGSTAAYFTEAFAVANPQTDTTRPTITAISPASGSTVLYSAGHIELAFSKAMDPATLTAYSPGGIISQGNFSLYVDGSTAVPLTVAARSSTRAALEFTTPPGATVTLIASEAITDYEGNNLVPFRASFVTSNKPAGGAAHLVRQYPYDQSSGAPVSAVITTWSAPLDPDSVQQNLMVYTSNGPVTGSVQWSGDFKAFAFTPAAPFADGVTVSAALLPPAHDAAGLPISWNSSFNSGYHPTMNVGSLGITGSNFPAYPAVPPLNFKMELQFNQDLTDAVLGTVKATFGKSQSSVQNCPFVRTSPRVLLFTPPISLAANTGYYFNFSAGSLTWNSFFTTGSSLASQNPAVSAAGPVGSNVPQNTGLGVLFSEPVSTLATPVGITLTAGGVAIPLNYNWTGPQSISLQPTTILQPNTTYTVTVSGFENAAAIAIPARTWSFQTGAFADVTPPNLLRILPSGSGISADSVVSFTFDKPVNPGANASNFNLLLASGNVTHLVALVLGFSDDLQTAYLRPSSLLAAGATYQATVGLVQDFAGNAIALSNPPSSTFQVGYTPPVPAAVTGCSPPANAMGVPVNAIVQVAASANLLMVNGLSATLAENGNPLDFALKYSADGLTLTMIPTRPLAPESQIDVTINGIGDAPYGFTFFTGTAADQVAPVSTPFPTPGLYPAPASVVTHIRFNKPLNPLSVNLTNVTLLSSNNAYLDIAVSLDSSGRLISVEPRLPLPAGMTYSVTWSVSDLAGNLANGSTNFTVGPQDDTPATLVGIDPADGSTGVGTTPTIQAIFTQPVEFTMGYDSLVLLLNGVPVPGKVALLSTAISFTPSRALQPGATYSLQLRGVADAFGAAVPDASTSFTTALPSDTIPPLKFVSSVPASGSAGVPANAPVRLTFNHPVTLTSAVALTSSYSPSYNRLYVSVQVQGNDVVLTPLVPFSGTDLSIVGSVRDFAGYSAFINVYYTLAPIQDTTPPTLEYASPPAGSTIPVTGANLFLRFSEPVQVGQNAIRVIGGTVGNWYTAEDGRTLVASQGNFSPDSDITIGLTSGITDFTGNPLAPLSYQLHSLSAAQSAAPKVGSITPPFGALNVPVDSSIQLQFTHAMDPTSLNLGLHVTADGIVVTGSTNASSDGTTFTFQPDLPFNKGAFVTVAAGSPAEDVASQALIGFNSSFTVIKDSTTPIAVALSATANAVDVRFDAPLDHYRPEPYLRSGFERIASRWELRGRDWLRIVPDSPLQPGRDYRLVLDAQTEFPLRLVDDSRPPRVEELAYDGRTLRIRFDREPGFPSIELTTPNGSAVEYDLDRSIDGRELRLRLKTKQPDLVIHAFGLGPLPVTFDPSRNGVR